MAGIGNIFFGDDGFGSAVVSALHRSGGTRPDGGVRVVDYGIRGLHLAYDLLAGVDALVLVDTVSPRDGASRPGDLVSIEVSAADLGEPQLDAHSTSVAAVLASLASLGGQLPSTLLVGCVPADLGEGLGLSTAVQAAVEPAARLVIELVDELVDDWVSAAPARPAAAGAGG